MKRIAPAKIRLSAVLAIAAAVLSAVALFLTAQKVQVAEARLQQLQDDAASEKKSLHVLHAEWDYLNRPDRLEALARGRLDMIPPHVGEVVGSPAGLDDPAPAPAHKPVVKAQPAVMRAPAAPAPLSAAVAMEKPVAPQAPAADRRGFQDLLNDLDKKGAAP
jgi:cell division protein FtsB